MFHSILQRNKSVTSWSAASRTSRPRHQLSVITVSLVFMLFRLRHILAFCCNIYYVYNCISFSLSKTVILHIASFQHFAQQAKTFLVYLVLISSACRRHITLTCHLKITECRAIAGGWGWGKRGRGKMEKRGY